MHSVCVCSCMCMHTKHVFIFGMTDTLKDDAFVKSFQTFNSYCQYFCTTTLVSLYSLFNIWDLIFSGALNTENIFSEKPTSHIPFNKHFLAADMTSSCSGWHRRAFYEDTSPPVDNKT